MATFSTSVLSKGGAVLSGDQLKEYATRQGLCPICAQSKTHKRRGSFFAKSWEPITVKEGEAFTVYKGYCLQPTCYTLAQAHRLSGTDDATGLRKFVKMFPKRNSPTRAPTRGVPTSLSFGGMTRSTAGSSQSSLLPHAPLLTGRPVTSSSLLPTLSTRTELEEDDEDDTMFKPPTTIQSIDMSLVHAAVVEQDAFKLFKILENQSDLELVAACWRALTKLGRRSVEAALTQDTSLVISRLHDSISSASTCTYGMSCIAHMVSMSADWSARLVAHGIIDVILRINVLYSSNISIADSCCMILEVLLGVVNLAPTPALLDCLLAHLKVTGTRSDDAARALFHLVQSGLDSDFYEQMSTGTADLWHKVAEDRSSYRVHEASLFLLWELSGIQPLDIGDDSLKSLLITMSRNDDMYLLDAALGLLTSANLCVASVPSDDVMESVAIVVCYAMSRQLEAETVQVKGLYILFKYLSICDEMSTLTLQAIAEATWAATECDYSPVLHNLCSNVLSGILNQVSEDSALVGFKTAMSVKRLSESAFKHCDPAPSTVAAQEAVIGLLEKMSSKGAASLFQTNIVADLYAVMLSEEQFKVSLHGVIANLLVASLGASVAGSGSDSVTKLDLISDSVELLQASMEIKEVCRDCCQLFAAIYASSPFQGNFGQQTTISIGSNSVSFESHTSEELSSILQAIKTHVDDEAVQQAGCLALANFFSLSRRADDQHHASTRLVQKGLSRIFPVLVQTLERHAGHPLVVKSGISLLITLQEMGSPTHLKEWSPALLLAAFQAVHGLKEDADMSKLMMSVVKHFTRQRDLYDSMLVPAVFKFLKESLLHHLPPLDTVEQLYHLIRQDPEVVEHMLNSPELIPRLLSLVYESTSNLEFQSHLHSVIEIVVYRQQGHVCEEIVRLEGLTKLSWSLARHSNNCEILEMCCRTILGILPFVRGTELIEHASSLQLNLSTILETVDQPSTTAVLIEVFLEVGDAIEPSPGLERVLLLPHILRFMASHSDCAELLKTCCSAIRNIIREQQNLAIFHETQVVSYIADALLIHSDRTDFLLQGLATLKTLLVDEDLSRSIHFNVLEASLLGLIQTKSSCARVVSESLSALNNLAVSTSGVVAPIGDGTVDTVLLAMRRFASDKEVQEAACRLIKNYTYSDSNSVLELSSRSNDLFPPMLEAATAFPDECGAAVQYVILKL